jgi:hypothetical protein
MPDHRCDERSIDYSTVLSGWIRCVDCGRRWTLTGDGWVMIPREQAPPR